MGYRKRNRPGPTPKKRLAPHHARWLEALYEASSVDMKACASAANCTCPHLRNVLAGRRGIDAADIRNALALVSPGRIIPGINGNDASCAQHHLALGTGGDDTTLTGHCALDGFVVKGWVEPVQDLWVYLESKGLSVSSFNNHGRPRSMSCQLWNGSQWVPVVISRAKMDLCAAPKKHLPYGVNIDIRLPQHGNHLAAILSMMPYSSRCGIHREHKNVPPDCSDCMRLRLKRGDIRLEVKGFAHLAGAWIPIVQNFFAPWVTSDRVTTTSLHLALDLNVDYTSTFVFPEPRPGGRGARTVTAYWNGPAVQCGLHYGARPIETVVYDKIAERHRRYVEEGDLHAYMPAHIQPDIGCTRIELRCSPEAMTPPLLQHPWNVVDELVGLFGSVRVVRAEALQRDPLSMHMFALAKAIGVVRGRGKGTTHDSLHAIARAAQLRGPEDFADTMAHGLWQEMYDYSNRMPTDLEAFARQGLPDIKRDMSVAFSPAPESWRQWGPAAS